MTPGEVIALAGLALTLIGATWRWIVLPLRRLDHERDQRFQDWYGVPARDGVPARPGVMRRLETLEGTGADHEDRIRQLEALERIKSHDEALGLYHLIETAIQSPGEATG